MRKKIETEVTYYSPKINLSLLDISNQIQEDLSNIHLERVRYGNFVELRIKSKDFDKVKLTFKINHGPIYYRFNKKIRLTDIEDKIQCYDESIDDWASIDSLDLEIFNSEILAFYYKETFKKKINEDTKLVMHNIQYLNEEGCVQHTGDYIEAEFKKANDTIVDNIDKELHRMGWEPLKIETSKVYLGQQALNGNVLQISTIEELKELLYKIFTQMTFKYIR